MVNRRNPKVGILRWLEQCPQPVYALDDERHVVFVNDSAVNWLGLPREQLVGLVCNFHSRSDAELPQRVAASICPPPETFQGQASRTQVGGFVRSVEQHDLAETRTAHFWPIADPSGAFQVLAFVDAPPANESRAAPRDSGEVRPTDLHLELVRWRRETAAWFRLDRFLGVSDAMRHVQRTAKAAIASGADIAISGPSGAGMATLARAIHYSQFQTGIPTPLVPLDCVIGDAEALHVALRQLQSDRERSAKGRLLLLNADRMNAKLMAELSGFVAVPQFDVGILSVSEIPLRDLVETKQIDRGLGLHLSTLEIRLPALRERSQDLPLLCQALVEDFNAEGNRQISGLHADTLELLYQYPWPGNLDELAQVVHSACIAASESMIRPGDLPKSIHQGISAVRHARPLEPDIDLPLFLKEIEDELMRRAIQVAKGNKTKAARLLGVSRQRMIRWSEQHSAE